MMTNPVEKQRILVVDDEPTNIAVLAGILKDQYQIRAATNGEKALEIARSEDPPDIILLDIMMPEMDGWEVCRRLKSDYTTSRIPVVFVTAMIDAKDEVRGFELGAADYITKPVSPPIVEARVKTQLSLFDQTRELDLKVQRRTRELNVTRLGVIQRLGRAAEYKDEDTGLHVIRMSHYSRIIGLAAGMDERDADTLLNAAPMHDVGKIGIPDKILQKPGKLDENEWREMQRHCEYGVEIIGDPQGSELLEMASTVALTHHEKWDGSGYPRRLAGEEIPLVGRIVAIADVFDALTSERPYKQAWAVEDAVALLENGAGTHFDARLVKGFVASLPDILKIREQYQDN